MKTSVKYLALAASLLLLAASCDSEQRDERRQQRQQQRLDRQELRLRQKQQQLAARQQELGVKPAEQPALSQQNAEPSAEIETHAGTPAEIRVEERIDETVGEVAGTKTEMPAPVLPDKISLDGKLRIEAIEDFSLNGLTSVSVRARINNSTSRDLAAESGTADIYQNGSKICTVTLDRAVAIARRSVRSVEAELGLRVDNMFSALSLANKVRRGDMQNIMLTVRAVISIDGQRRDVYLENVPLAEVVSAASIAFNSK